jgi:hypothetical protein
MNQELYNYFYTKGFSEQLEKNAGLLDYIAHSYVGSTHGALKGLTRGAAIGGTSGALLGGVAEGIIDPLSNKALSTLGGTAVGGLTGSVVGGLGGAMIGSIHGYGKGVKNYLKERQAQRNIKNILIGSGIGAGALGVGGIAYGLHKKQ